jgi:thiol:disulfide interchange protein
MRAILAALAGLFLFVSPALAAPVNTGHIKAELVAQDAAAPPGATVYVALRQKIDDGWHTYWRNPGDSGEATKIVWTLPAGWKAGDIVWKTPGKLPVGPLTNYGYEGEVILPVPLEVPADATPGSTVTLKAAVGFLVCKDICIPEDAALSIDIKVADGAPQPDGRWGRVVADALAAAPKAAGLTAAYQYAPGKLTLAVAGAPLKGADMAGAWFYPYQGVWIDHAGAQTVERGPDGLTLTLPAGYVFETGKPPAMMDGVIVLKGHTYEVTAPQGPAPAGAAGLAVPPASSGASEPGAAGGMGVGLAIAFAFLGGLILNLMPCVFPVLSMKAASLAGHAHESRKARAQGIAYGAGVLATFLALAAVLIGLKLAGSAVGWGFQLQSPPVVAGLAVLMLAVALNMSGVFEVGASLQGAGQGLASRSGLAGAFFTGALAVVVASPCTAPFMGPAMGFALAQSPMVILAVFAALAIGFAAPFVALAFAPALLKRLPRPGAWMDVLRKGLAFPMYGAVAWLVWVLVQQTDAAGLAAVLLALVVAAFGLWLYGLSQAGGRTVPRLLAILLVMAAAALAVLTPKSQAPAPTGAASTAGATAEVPYEAWSPERVAALRAEGRPILVNFTAAWCVTCQVNDKVALSTPPVAEALKAVNGVYLKGDWTNRNPAIAAALAEYGRAGVPLYLVYAPGTEKAVVLPQLLTPGMVAEALRKAGAMPAA